MERTDDPATDIQLRTLRQYGYAPTRPLTKAEATDLIHQIRTRSNPGVALPVDAERAGAGLEAYNLRRVVEECVRAYEAELTLEKRDCLRMALEHRQDFWMDTCREPTHMKHARQSVLTLYRDFGCRFEPPTRESVQEILAALDAALPVWDRDHPELFYQTLELNHRELVHSHGMTLT